MNSTTVLGIVLIAIGSALQIYGPTLSASSMKAAITGIGLILTGLGTYLTIYGPGKDAEKEIEELKSELKFQNDHFLNEKRSTTENSYHINDKFGDALLDNDTKISYIKAETSIFSKLKKELNLNRFATKVTLDPGDNPFIMDAMGSDEEQVGPDAVNYYYFTVYNHADSLTKNSQLLIRSFDTFFSNYRERLNPTHQQHKAVLILICKNKKNLDEQVLGLFDQYNRPPIFETMILDISKIKFYQKGDQSFVHISLIEK